MIRPARSDVQFLILGAGWTSKFLIPELDKSDITYAATTTTGRDGTITFKFDPSSDDPDSFRVLPSARTILITFPLRGIGQAARLVKLYNQTHETASGAAAARWIQLGSTSIYQAAAWSDHKSPYNKENDRAIAEDELLYTMNRRATVFNLAGLYDDNIRIPKNWVSRVAKSKQDVQAKTSLHLIHGVDVARAIVAAHKDFDKVAGDRWILTDLYIYDWWALLLGWGGHLQSGEDLKDVVVQCMNEAKVRALPRSPQSLGRTLSSIEFWNAVGLSPSQGKAV